MKERFTHYTKIKLETKEDIAIVTELRKHTDAILELMLTADGS
jgi:hypothetical protein